MCELLNIFVIKIFVLHTQKILFIKSALISIQYVAQRYLDSGVPNGNRTRVSAVKGRRPRPLDDGD